MLETGITTDVFHPCSDFYYNDLIGMLFWNNFAAKKVDII
jgi:hypothetical protein